MLEAITGLPDEANVTTSFRRLFSQFNLKPPTPQWLKEAYYFELFRRDYELPEGEILYGDKPDVVLAGPRKIGIEITNFYLNEGNDPKSEQIQSKVREAVVRKAQRIYLTNGGKSVDIWFGFNMARPILNPEELAERMVQLARQIEGCPTGMVWREKFESIPELSHVYLNAEKYDDPKWRVSQVYSGRLMSRDKLLEIVRKKERQCTDYQSCDAYWLLVVVDFIDRAQDQEIRIDDFEKVDSAIFEKVLVYRTAYEHVLEASR